MRIAGGEFGGRRIEVPKSGALRPTQDMVREALFSMLAASVPGCRFLDLFAGSGAVGLEAISRGAASAVFVERDRRHAAVVRANADALLGPSRAGAVHVAAADAYSWAESFSGEPFDIAFADPPYALGAETGHARLLAALAGRGAVRAGGFFAAEAASSQSAVEFPGWELWRDRSYGKTRVCIWRRASAPEDAAPDSPA